MPTAKEKLFRFVYAFDDPAAVTLIRCKSAEDAYGVLDLYRREYKTAGIGRWDGTEQEAQEEARKKGWTVTGVIDNG